MALTLSGRLALAAGVSLVLAAAVLPMAVLADSRGALAESQAQLKAGRPAQAARLLEKARQAEPFNAEVLLALGTAYKQAKSYKKAKEALRAALKAGRGTPLAAQANQELLSLPREIVAPKAKRLVARVRGRRVAPAGLHRVKMIAFTASWAQPCKQLQEDIDKAKAQWGDQIEIVAVDVDDPKNEQLLEQYDVSPVPTVVFLDQDGQMVSFMVGYSGLESLNSKVKTLTGKTS